MRNTQGPSSNVLFVIEHCALSIGVVLARRAGPCGPADSVKDLSLVRGRDLQLLAILGDRAARELEPFPLQNADDLRIAQRLARVFLLDDLADALFDRDRGDRLAVGA